MGVDCNTDKVYLIANNNYKYEAYEVVAFTATQIPYIENRRYPAELAGKLYPKGIPIYGEEELPQLIKDLEVDECVFSYSDVSYRYVMSLSALVNTAGANFVLLGPNDTMIESSKPVISICATRTGVGKSQTSRRVIELLMERDIPLRLKMMVMTLNAHELAGARAFADELGLPFRYDAMINGALDGLCHPTQLRLSPEEVVQFDLADEARLESWQEFCERYVNPSRTASTRLYPCGAGLRSFHIDPYGRLSPCIISREPSYDLRSGSFAEAWHDFLPRVRALEAGPDDECSRCALRPLCGQCPGWAQLEHGDPEKPVDFLCRVAHLRADALGIPT